MRAFDEIHVVPTLSESDLSEKIYREKGIYKLDKTDFAKFYVTFYKSMYPDATDDSIFDLYLLASDVCFAAFLAQNKHTDRISKYWVQLSRDEFDLILKNIEIQKIPKNNLTFEHYYADYLIDGSKSLYFDKFVDLCKNLGSGFIFFMIANCFRAMCGGLYSAPTIEDDNLQRFVPSFKTSLEEFPFLFDEKIPFFYDYRLNAIEILQYLFSNYDSKLLKMIWTNFLSERIPEAACEGDPKEFMETLFDKSFFWITQNRWDDFIEDKSGLDWVIRYNNSPELIFHFRRHFYWYFKNHTSSVFSLN